MNHDGNEHLYEGEYYLKLEDASIYYKVIGEGVPLFLLHGGPGFSHDYLLPHLVNLADEGFQLVFMDHRGGGRSAEPYHEATIKLDMLVEDIESLRVELGLQQINIIGHSFGGIVAVQYALKYGDCLNKMVLCNCASFVQSLSIEGERVRAQHMQELEHPLLAFFHNPMNLSQLIPGPHFMNEQYYGLTSSKLGADSFHTVESIRLGDVQATTLIIHGREDFIPCAASAYLANRIPNSRLHYVEECGHFAFIEQNEEVNTLISLFLKDL